MFSLSALEYFHFLRPLWLLGLIPFTLLMLWQLRQRESRLAWGKIIAPHLLTSLIVKPKVSQSSGPLAAMGLMICLLFTALAGPAWFKSSSPLSEDNAALLIALDVSGSMDQNDVSPSRLQRAKQKIMDLLELRGDSYTGLIAFAGSAHTVIPLSNDRKVISHFLNAMNTQMMPREGKIVEAVLPLTQSLLKDLDTPASLLLIGDGASEIAVSAFQDFFSASEHQLLILGIGLSQAQLDQQAEQDYGSSVVALQDNQLKEIAKLSKGYYQPMTVDKTDVNNIYQRVDNYFLQVDDDSRPWVDMGYWLIFPLMLLTALWFRKGWVLQW